MSHPTMAAGFVAGLLDYASNKGASRTALLAACGLSEDDLADQDNRVPLGAYRALTTAAMEHTGDTALVLRHTLESRMEAMSIVGQIVHHTASLAQLIEQLNRYLRLMAEIDVLSGRDRFELFVDADEVWIVDHLPVQSSEYVGLEASFARFISEFRSSVPDRTFALEMEVTYAPPPHAGEYPDLFQIPVRFGAARNALRIHPDWLSENAGTVPGNEYVFGVFTKHADELLSDLEHKNTVRAMIESHILPGLHEGTLSMDKVARELGMSRQTLYRRLKTEGVTFAEILDDLRHRMARDYLTARKVSVNETAYLLGFSEASSFVRAFKRWTGHSPTAFRDNAI